MFDKKNQGRWWDFGWQLVEGCTKISPACENCWSLTKEKRFRKETGVVFHPERLERPLKRKKPASYAIWNDLFHESMCFQDIIEVFHVMKDCPQHIFLILTKRPEKMHEFFNDFIPNPHWENLSNVWIGTTIENQEQAEKRIPFLLEIPAKVRFVSVEPMLGGIDLKPIAIKKFINHIKGITTYPLDWVICGPETGHNARPTKKEWVEDLYKQCKAANVPFFDKKNILGKGLKEMPK